MKATRAKMNAIIVADSDELAHQTLELFVEDAKKAIKKQNRFCVAITRHSPRSFFNLLGTELQSKNLPWDKIHLFWADQCCDSPDSINNTNNITARSFMRKVDIPIENIHPICSQCHGCEYAASLYEQTILSVFGTKKNEVPRFDLIMLGMGRDAHVASLFPDTYAFFERKDLVRVVYCMDKRHTRITLTQPILRTASHIVVHVCGREKAQILRNVFTAKTDEVRYPVHTIWPILDKVTWLIDRAAGRLLPSGNRPNNLPLARALYTQPSDRRIGG